MGGRLSHEKFAKKRIMILCKDIYRFMPGVYSFNEAFAGRTLKRTGLA